jgi:Circadian oscillating protein COP23
MKYAFLPTLILSTSLVTAAMSLPVSAQPNAPTISPSLQFSCGQVSDPSSRTVLPATIVKSAEDQEGKAIIVWKSESFIKFSPQKRCEIVTPKIQTAFQEGRVYIGAGIDANGYGIICGVADPQEKCTSQNMLFTLKSYQSADETIQRIVNLFRGVSSDPSYQSSGKKRVNMRYFSSKRPAR